jgi:hypothetical protein
MRLKTVAMLGVILFTISVTFLVSTAPDTVYMWSEKQTGGDMVEAIQLVFLVAYVIFVGALMLVSPGIIAAIPFRPIGFLVVFGVIGYVCYWGIGVIASGG